MMPKTSMTIQRGTIYRSAAVVPMSEPRARRGCNPAWPTRHSRGGWHYTDGNTQRAGDDHLRRQAGHPRRCSTTGAFGIKAAASNLITEKRTGITVTTSASRNCLGKIQLGHRVQRFFSGTT